MNARETRDDPYADLAELYDLEHAGISEDIDLYLRLAEVVGDPILELGCGTGRILARLAEAGHRVVGADRSAPMLERARAGLASEMRSGRISLVEGEMTEADRVPGGPFGLVILSLNGLLHLSSQIEQRMALAAARRALDPRGMLIVDLLNPSPDLLATFDGRVQHEGTWTQPDGATVDRFSARTHYPATQSIGTEIWFDFADASESLRRVRSGFTMRYLMPSELTLLLELVGFAEWKLYGSYDLEPFDDDSERLIVTAEVTPAPD